MSEIDALANAERLFAERSYEGAEAALEAAMQRADGDADATALRAAIRCARYGVEYPLLDTWGKLSEPARLDVARACVERGRNDPPEIALGVLVELRERVEDADPLDDMLPALSAAIANVAWDARQHDTATAMFDWLTEDARRTSELERALYFTLAAAIVRDDGGDVAGTNERLRRAQTIADAIADDRCKARVERTAGLLASRHGDDERAARSLDAAVALTRPSGGRSFGRTLLARGVHAQHRGEPVARALLEQALGLLSPQDVDAGHTQAHLAAQRPCLCASQPIGPSAMFDQLVRRDVREGLLRKLGVDPTFALRVQLPLARREISDAARWERARASIRRRRWDHAQADWEKLIGYRPTNTFALEWSDYYAEARQWDRAIAEQARVVARHDRVDLAKASAQQVVDAAEAHQRYAFLHLVSGDHAGYRAACDRMRERLANHPIGAIHTAWACAAGPNGIDDAGELLARITTPERALRTEYTLGDIGAGALAFRAGRIEQAMVHLEQGRGRDGGWWYSPFLAMAHHRAGRRAAAKHWLDEAERSLPEMESGLWNRRDLARAIQREAELLVRPGDLARESKPD